MAHFAELNSNNVVLRVVVVENKDTIDAHGVEKEHIGVAHLEKVLGGTWKQTSYNGNIRKNFAGIGFTYNVELDAFVPPKPFPSWILNTEQANWNSPTPLPSDASELVFPEYYDWDEDTISWVKKTHS